MSQNCEFNTFFKRTGRRLTIIQLFCLADDALATKILDNFSKFLKQKLTFSTKIIIKVFGKYSV